MTAPLPLCVVGAGMIGMRHVEVAQACDTVRLTAVVEADAGRRAALAAQGLPVAAALDDVPGETRAAIVATPTPDHGPSGQRALDLGMAVLVEKPLTGTIDEARALIAAARAAGLPLITGHHRRCHPFSQAARAALAEIGAPVGVQGLWSVRKHDTYYDVPWRRQPGAGPLMTNLSHEIDLMRFLLGDIAQVTALTSHARRGLAVEDTAALAFRFDNGALGSVLISDAGASPWSFEQSSGENPEFPRSGLDYLRIVGEAGALAFPSLTRWQQPGGGEVEWRKPFEELAGAPFDRIDPLLAQVGRFAAVVGGALDDVLCTGEDGLAALEMTLATALSGQTGRPVRRGEVPGDFRGT
ncbi:MAG: Gfo/Idh/MocA family oxidoreductase [Roseivivax sp.]|nr:Gfo/Idh/MocA family oxidoreductase [Roseivivax sp.]